MPPRPAAKPRARADRLDRGILSGIGVLLVATGGYGVARGLGAFGAAESGEAVLTEGLRAGASERPILLLLIAAGLALLVAFLSYRWLCAQLRPRFPAGAADRTRPHPAAGAGGGGPAEEPVPRPGSAAARKAVEREVRLYPGVDRVSARVVSEPPSVVLRVRTLAGCDVPALTQEINQRALPMLRSLLAAPDLTARLEIRLGDRPDPEDIKRQAQAARARPARR